MTKTFKFILVGLILGMFLLEASQAYAIMGTRIARRVAAAREARQQLAEKPDSQVEAKDPQDMKHREPCRTDGEQGD